MLSRVFLILVLFWGQISLCAQSNIKTKIAIVGHRGDETYYHENSFASIISAIVKKADFIEIDLRLTQDGVPILYHDDTFKSDLECGDLSENKINQLTLNQIKKECRYKKIILRENSDFELKEVMDKAIEEAGDFAYQVLSFEELLGITNNHSSGIYIELKDYMMKEILSPIEQLQGLDQCLGDNNSPIASTYNCLKKIKIISFNHRLLRKIKNHLQLDDQTHPALRNLEFYPLESNIVHRLDNDPTFWVDFDGVAFYYDQLAKDGKLEIVLERIKKKNANYTKAIWTVPYNAWNEYPLLKMNLDAIITSNPGEILNNQLTRNEK